MAPSPFPFLLGCNYPWTLLNGVSNCGRDLGAILPVVVGEYPVNGEGVDGFVDEVERAGFAGALFWSVNNVDRCVVESVEKIGSMLAAAAPEIFSKKAGLA